MRWTTLMWGGPIAMGLVLTASVATASESTPEPEPEDDVALLAGFQASPAYAGYAGLGGLSLPYRPAAVATLEMRTTERMWWMLRGAASYGTQTHRSSYGDARAHAFGVQLGTGLRYVVNPGDTIEFSPHVLVGGGYTAADYQGHGSTQWTARASTGLNLDVEVAPGFGVRMSTDVLSAGYGHTSAAGEGYDETSHSFDVSLAFSPSLEARFTF